MLFRSNIENLNDSVYVVIGTDTVAYGEATSTDNFLLTSETTLNDNINGYSVKALVRDYAGNLSVPSIAITVRIDSTAPNTPGIPNLLPAYNTGF